MRNRQGLLSPPVARRRAFLLCCCGALVLGCAKKADDPDDPSEAVERSEEGASGSPEPGVTITAPMAGATVSGRLPVTFELAGLSDGRRLWFGLAGELAPAKYAAASFDIETTALDNGEHVFVVQLRDEQDGVLAEDSVDVTVDNPSFRLASYALDQVSYGAGEPLALTLQYGTAGLTVAADFSSIDDDENVPAEDLGDGAYRVRHVLGGQPAAGVAAITIRASDGSRSLVSEIDVPTRALPRLPFALPAATLVDRPVPRLVVDDEMVAPQVHAPLPLVGKANAPVTVTWPEPLDETADRLLVTADGFHGYYVVPLKPGMAEVELPVRASKAQVDGPFVLRVAAIDDTGSSSGWQTVEMQSRDVSLGGIQVTLYWDAPVDMDLSVIDPTGALLDFEAPSANGGMLNLDANALCELHSAFAENVSWAQGAALPGDYDVRVNLFDSCGYEGEVNWWITAVVEGAGVGFIPEGAGEATTNINLSGTIDASEIDMSGQGRSVGGFELNGVETVGGVVTFEKNPTGTYQDVPGQSLPVRAVSALDESIELGRSVTDTDGVYSMTLDNPDGDPYFIIVEASYARDESSAPIGHVVDPQTSALYEFKTSQLSAMPGSAQQQDIRIGRSDGSGAFNIIGIVREGFEWVFSHWANAPLPPMRVQWRVGYAAGSHYDPGPVAINLMGTSADPDEFDDSVIIHEFFHYVYYNIVTSSVVGGSHGHSQVQPDLAFSEGLPTGFGQRVLGTDVYIDKANNNTVVGRTPLETNTRVAYRDTHDSTMTGNVCEFLISMVIWDIADPENESHDMLSDEGLAVGALLHTLKSQADRGYMGFDFVEFLDAVRCRSRGAASGAFAIDRPLRRILIERSYPYDFKPDITCP